LPSTHPRSRVAVAVEGPEVQTTAMILSSRSRFRGRFATVGFAVSVGLAACLAPSSAHAAPPAADLMSRLAVHAASFESMRTRASYAIDGKLEHLDSDGKVDSTDHLEARVVADGKKAEIIVMKFLEGNEDKTEEAQEKARERNAAPEAEKEKKRTHMPFLASEQRRYAFDQVQSDPADPTHVRITFVPHVKDETVVEGSAWVDTKTGTVMSAGFKMSKTGMFVDYVHVTVEFGATTPLGPAVSKVTLEGKGSFLFIKKRFRAAATVSRYRIAPPQGG
jgi:hypothetical protein